MKSTGITRKIDELGRVVLPIELRRTLDLNEKDPVEIFVDGDKVILKKHVSSNACVVTGVVSEDNFQLYGKWFSLEGAKKIVQVLQDKGVE